jgi:arginine/lysine/histidine/glutamine transport system substrate-binding/permease protein
MAESLEIFLKAIPTLLVGAAVTIQLTLVSIFVGMILGSLVGVLSLSRWKPVRLLMRFYVDFVRGTPLLVQIFMVYFGLPALANNLGWALSFERWAAGILALGLNVAAYIAEIVRAGIQSIQKGQWEAAESLGLGGFQVMCYVIFPQAFRRMLPALGNEFITLLKDTSLVAIIGYEELFRKGQLIVANNYRAFEIYTAVAIGYLIMTVLASQGFHWLERRLNPLNTPQTRQSVAPELEA